MENPHPTSDQPLSILTVADLEALIVKLETMLLEGLNSGDATEMTVQDWEDIRQVVRERMSKR